MFANDTKLWCELNCANSLKRCNLSLAAKNNLTPIQTFCICCITIMSWISNKKKQIVPISASYIQVETVTRQSKFNRLFTSGDSSYLISFHKITKITYPSGNNDLNFVFTARFLTPVLGFGLPTGTSCLGFALSIWMDLVLFSVFVFGLPVLLPAPGWAPGWPIREAVSGLEPAAVLSLWTPWTTCWLERSAVLLVGEATVVVLVVSAGGGVWKKYSWKLHKAV